MDDNEEPLLSDEETSALLEAMREEETRGDTPEARPTELGSPEGPLREALGRADAAVAEVGKAARTQLLKQIAMGVTVELLPAEIVPRDVLSASVDPKSLVFTLSHDGESQGLISIDPQLGRFILFRAMGASGAEPPSASTGRHGGFSGLDKRILKPFPRAIVDALGREFLAGRRLALTEPRDADDAAGVRFEPMLRIGVRFGTADGRIGEILIALTASAVASAIASESPLPQMSHKVKPRDRVAARLADAQVDLVAVLGRTESSVRALLALQRGDVLRLDRCPSDPVVLCVEDVAVANGNPVVHKGDLAIEVLERR